METGTVSSNATHAGKRRVLSCSVHFVLLTVALSGFFLVCCPRPYLPTLLTATYDTWTYLGPHAYYLDYSIHRGEFPEWNTLLFCGTPFAASPGAHATHPFNLLRSILTVHPTPYNALLGLYIMVGLHLLFGGICTVYLARVHGLSHPAAFAAALGFVLGASMVRWSVEIWSAATMAAWLPLMLILIRGCVLATSARKRLLFALLCGLVYGLNFVLANPSLCIHLSLTFAVYGLLVRLLEARPKPGGAWRALLADGVLFALVNGIAIACAAVLLIPSLELAGLSARIKGVGLSFLSDEGGCGPLRALYYLVVYAGTPNLNDFLAAGACVAFLGLASLLRARHKPVIIFGALFLVMLDYSIGPPMPVGALIDHLEPYHLAFPGRSMILTCLPLAMLAGLGIDAVTTAAVQTKARLARIGGLALAGGLVLIPLSRAVLAPTFLHVSILALAIPAAACGVAIAAAWRPWPKVWRVVLAGLVLSELVVWNREFLPHLLLRSRPEQCEQLRQARTLWNDNRRGTDSFPDVGLMDLRGAMTGYDPIYLNRSRAVLCAPQFETTYRRGVSDFEVTRDNQRGNLFLKRSFWLARQWVRGALPPKDRLYPAATTVFVETADALPVRETTLAKLSPRSVSEDATQTTLTVSEPTVTRDADGRMLRVFTLTAPSLPSLHSALELDLRASAGVTVDTAFREPGSTHTEFGYRHEIAGALDTPRRLEVPMPDIRPVEITVTITGPDGPGGAAAIAAATVVSDSADEDARIQRIERRANSVGLDVSTAGPEPRMLLFVDADYAGWTARVDGQPAKIYRANDAFKSVVVPPGDHHVEFRYRSNALYVGAGISVATALGVLIGVAWLCAGGVTRGDGNPVDAT